MSNSARWRRLLEWLRDLSDSSDTNSVNYDTLMKKIEEIKRGGQNDKNVTG